MQNGSNLVQLPNRARASERPARSEYKEPDEVQQVTFEVVDDVAKELYLRPEYDVHASYLAAVAAAWAYGDEQALQMVLAKCGMMDTKIAVARIENPALLIDVDAFIIYGKTTTGARVGILCFRGTEFGTADLIDILTDADVEMRPSFSRDGNVHKGFYNSILFVWDYVMHAIQRCFMENDQLIIDALYITGHSLGGALAQLAGDRVWKEPKHAALKEKLMGVYTYGQPAVGDNQYRTSCEKSGFSGLVFRHVYGVDWVPMLPPLSTGYFVHIGQLFVSTPTGWMPSSRKPGRALTIFGSGLLASAAFTFKRFAITGMLVDLTTGLLRALNIASFSLEDHMPAYYIECSRRSQTPTFP